METSNEQSQGQTIKCPACKEDIQLGAKKCKHCDADLRNWFIKHKIITGILIIIGIGIIGSAMGGNETKNTSSNTSTVNNTQEAKSAADAKSEADDQSKTANVPAEYKSALNKATTYASTMYMSKQGVYDQLVSQYGEKFSAAAAQYAIDNMKADWNANALAKAKTYQDTMNMSPASIHDQLTSVNGEKFTKAEADYAIQHLNE
jgi:hypothetical protein